ncbi:MAG: FkbM family methyltransferase [Bacteriovoracaceae bacterium]|jgi:FkbM family methyltransferase
MSALKSFTKSIVPTFIWNKLRSVKLKHEIDVFESFVVENLYCGEKLKVCIEDGLGNGWYAKEWGRVEEIEFLVEKGILTNGTKIFDLGAHQSVVAMILAKKCGVDGKVLALEANSHNYAVSNKNKDINNIENLVIEHAAISDVNGEVEFNENLNGSVVSDTMKQKKVVVPSYNLDHLMKAHFTPDIIYLDVEGYEYIVLKGAEKALSLNINWFIEVHGDELIGNFGGKAKDIFDYFSNGDFELHIGYDNAPFVPYEPSEHKINERCFLIALKKA